MSAYSQREARRSSHVPTDPEARRWLEAGVTPLDIVRIAWPDATDEEADFLLWQLTPFPMVTGVHDVCDAVASAYIDQNVAGGQQGLPPD